MNNITNFGKGIEERATDIANACTQCGKCFEVCPMVGPAGIGEAKPQVAVAGVVEILRTGRGNVEGRTWAEICSHSGFCSDACDYGVDPRLMLTLARLSLKRGGSNEVRRQGATNFQEMVRATRILPRLQLNSEDLMRISTGQWTNSEPPDLVFYTGCNILRTPHIALLCLDVLSLLDFNYVVFGGPANCCGILQFRPGDKENAGRQAYATIKRFIETGSSEVVTWCPTCKIQIGETVLPIYKRTEDDADFNMTMFAMFLLRHIDRLRKLFKNRVERRVALHEHPGLPGVTEAVRELLEAIPGLQFVDLEQERAGYMCNSLSALPEYRRELHEAQLNAAQKSGVDTLAGIYHACHRDLCAHERDWPFEIVNFMELIGEAIGVKHEDVFKRLKQLTDIDMIINQSLEMIEHYALDINEVREVVAKNMVGEQSLPLRGSLKGDQL